MKIYTKRGDLGETDLFGGGRSPKDSLRVEAYGATDELNSVIGFAAASLRVVEDTDIVRLLESIQSDLFKIGAELAKAPEADPKKLSERTTPVSEERITELESIIDGYEDELEPLRNFILPGGSEVAARLHVARAVCRRAERRVVSLARAEKISEEIVKYLNRLSDLLFVLARVANKRVGVRETEWKG